MSLPADACIVLAARGGRAQSSHVMGWERAPAKMVAAESVMVFVTRTRVGGRAACHIANVISVRTLPAVRRSMSAGRVQHGKHSAGKPLLSECCTVLRWPQ